MLHLPGATFHDDTLSYNDTSSKSLTGKEISIMPYPYSHVLGIFNRRINLSRYGYFNNMYYQQCLSFLMAGKFDGEPIVIATPQQRHSVFDLLEDLLEILFK